MTFGLKQKSIPELKIKQKKKRRKEEIINYNGSYLAVQFREEGYLITVLFSEH